MALNNWCWFNGKFSIMKGWRSFFFFSPLYSMTTLMQEALSVFSLFMQQLRCGFIQILLAQSSAQKKKKMGMDSSNVDKRTRLIPCRCVSELCEGTLCCPRRREKRTLHWRKFSELRAKKKKKTPALTQYSWFSMEEKGGNTGTHSFHSLEELSVCRITRVYVSHLKGIYRCFMETSPSQSNEWNQNSKHKREARSIADVAVIHFGKMSLEIRQNRISSFPVLILGKQFSPEVVYLDEWAIGTPILFLHQTFPHLSLRCLGFLRSSDRSTWLRFALSRLTQAET